MKAVILASGLGARIAKANGYQGNIRFDPSKPDGSPRKWMSSERLNELGWQAQVGLKNGLKLAYQDFLKA